MVSRKSLDYGYRSQRTLGLGGLVAPFVSTQFANMERWSFHYLVSLGLVLINFTCQITAFRLKRLDGRLFQYLYNIPL